MVNKLVNRFLGVNSQLSDSVSQFCSELMYFSWQTLEGEAMQSK